jgi:acetyltransferase-like isoleucine patch superfamily enzyme
MSCGVAELTEDRSCLPLVIFGDRLMASVVWHCVTRDAQRQVVGFSVEASHRSRDWHEGLPVVAFEELEAIFPPDRHELLIPSAAANVNGARRRLCEAARHKGYRLASYVSSQASVWPDTPLGEHCLVFERAVLQSFASLGHDVIVRSGANIGHHSVVADHCFIATGVVTGGNVTIGEQCSDLLFRASVDHSPGVVCFLFEHQSAARCAAHDAGIRLELAAARRASTGLGT